MGFEFNTFLHGLCERIVVEAIETGDEEMIKSVILRKF